MRVYIFSPIPYSFLHQRPQKIADHFRRQSIPVTYIEPYGFTEFFAGRKRLRPGDVFRSIFYHLIALKNLFFSSGMEGEGRTSTTVQHDTFEILTLPLIFPSNRINSSFLDRLNAAVYRQWFKRTIFVRSGCRENDVALVQQPFFGAVLNRNQFARMYYDCIDDISIFSGHGSRERFSEYEKTILSLSDAVFVTSESLETGLRRRIPELRIVRIPNGVDYDRFQELARSGPVPSQLGSLTGRVAGYVGILRAWFDTRLIERLARRHPEVTFVLVGPYDNSSEVKVLRGLSNVVLAGRVAYEQVPACINAFHVCLIPFLRDQVAETTNPVKVFEYFALGKPVVSTRLRELVPYGESGLLSLADSPEEFETSLLAMLNENDSSKVSGRKAVAQRNSWKLHATRMLDVMQGAG